MRKFLALVLALCMMAFVLPVFAESAEEASDSGLASLFSDILGGDGSLEDKATGLLEKISDLGESFTGSDNQLSAILSSLGDKLQGLIQPDEEEGLGSLLSGLKDQLSGLGSLDLGSLLGGLFGSTGEGESGGFDLSGLLSGLTGGDGEGFDLSSLGSLFGGTGEEGEAEDDGETLEETLARLNQEAEADTGDQVSGKKAAESVEEFYGNWNETKFTYLGEEYDASEYGEGVFIGENTYYVTQDGEKSEDYLYSENVEMFIRDGVLKIKTEEGHWTTFVLTEDGEIVMSSSSLLTHYVKAGE